MATIRNYFYGPVTLVQKADMQDLKENFFQHIADTESKPWVDFKATITEGSGLWEARPGQWQCASCGFFGHKTKFKHFAECNKCFYYFGDDAAMGWPCGECGKLFFQKNFHVLPSLEKTTCFCCSMAQKFSPGSASSSTPITKVIATVVDTITAEPIAPVCDDGKNQTVEPDAPACDEVKNQD